MASRNDTPTITRRRSVLACARCRARRVKCDRAQPSCSNCSKAGALCQPAQQPSPPSYSSRASKAGSLEADNGRLSTMEKESRSREAHSVSVSPEPSRRSSLEDARPRRENSLRGNIISGLEARYFSPFSWAAVTEELSDFESTLGNATGELDTNYSSSHQDPRLSLPDDQLHEVLFSLFRKRIDPLVRILHWPSFLEQYRIFRQGLGLQSQNSGIQDYSRCPYGSAGVAVSGFDSSFAMPAPTSRLPNASNTARFDTAFAGLLYSVYYAAVMSLIHAPNPPDLGCNVNPFTLAATFKREVSTRVMALDGGTTRPSLLLLQAMTLVLAVEPESFDVQSQWVQLTVAISRARELGLHRDGSNFSLQPIETELRRRVWAELCVLDIRYAEQLGREPTICPESYDTVLPLSIDDRDLAELEARNVFSRKGSRKRSLSMQELEVEQEQLSPFSPMTISLVGAENARMLAQLLTMRYVARDSITTRNGRRLSLDGNRLRTPADKLHMVNEMNERFRTVYGLTGVETTNAIHTLVTEIAAVSIDKARFVIRVLEWKEDFSMMSARRKQSETTKLFHDAIGLSTRFLSMVHRYTNSPYSWYIKRLRDPHTSAFIALNLAFGEKVDEESKSLGRSILGQLYPHDPTGVRGFQDHGLHRTVFGKIFTKALGIKSQRGLSRPHEGNAPQLSTEHDPLMFSMSMETDPVSLPPSNTWMGTSQEQINIFGELDAVMEDAMWPPGLSGTGQPYSAWDTTMSSASTAPYPSTPALFPPTLHPYPHSTGYPTPPMVSSHSPAASHTNLASLATNSAMTDSITLPSFHVQTLSPNGTTLGMDNPDTDRIVSPLEPSRTWPLQQTSLPQASLTHAPLPQGELHVPYRASRERSLSQPQQFNHLEVRPARLTGRPKSMSMQEEQRKSTSAYADGLRAMSTSPQMFH